MSHPPLFPFPGARDADRADRHALYLDSVQAPEQEVVFFTRAWRDVFGRRRRPRLLREDFCGSAAVACAWVQPNRWRRAVGVDLDPEVLDWGRAHTVAALTPAARERLTLRCADVREANAPGADIVVAQNYSFFLFTTRVSLRAYFTAVLRDLAPDGLLILDVLGGPDVQLEEHEDTRDNDGYTYVWEQRRFDPIHAMQQSVIHFRFPDGSALNDAFSYTWRVWTLPELRELLDEVGFDEVIVYWEGADAETGRGDGTFTPRDAAPSDACWFAYLVAVKRA